MSFRDRTSILIGEAGVSALAAARVAVYGLGGVGAACAMDLVRAGVGALYVVDFDTVSESNLNRLYFGYRSQIGRPKVEAFADFARQVNPEVRVIANRSFFSGIDAAEAIDGESDIHADCIDSLNAKVSLVAGLSERGLAFISSMGTAGRLSPERLKIASIWETRGCPLARSVRTRLRHRGFAGDFPVVYSDEEPVPPVPRARSTEMETEAESEAYADTAAPEDGGSPSGRERLVQGSSPFVPQAAGHIMAGWIARTILWAAESRATGGK